MALEFQDLGAAGEGPSETEGHQHRFGAGGGETNHLDARQQAAQPFGQFGLARMLRASSNETLTDSALFALPSMAPIRTSLDGELERLQSPIHRAFPAGLLGQRF